MGVLKLGGSCQGEHLSTSEAPSSRNPSSLVDMTHMLYLQLSSDQQWDTSPKLATRVANAPFLFAGCSQGPRAVGGAFEKVTSSPLPRKEMPAASDGGGAEAQRGAKGVTAKCTPLVTGWPGPSSQGSAGHLRMHARDQ